jgi:hypothetical protein
MKHNPLVKKLGKGKRLIFILLILCLPTILFSQVNEKQDVTYYKNYLSVNPLNIIFFQQVGITYERKINGIGIGITPGYIYPNNKEYSNWFLAGPITYGSLGYYSGYFVVPHMNIYLNKPKNVKQNGQIFISIKMVYKNIKIDSTKITVWENYGDGYASYRKMNDNVNIYGGFVDFGFRYIINRFYIESNLGMGFLWTNHDMLIVGKGINPSKIESVNPPLHATKKKFAPTINFTLNIGIAF